MSWRYHNGLFLPETRRPVPEVKVIKYVYVCRNCGYRNIRSGPTTFDDFCRDCVTLLEHKADGIHHT